VRVRLGRWIWAGAIAGAAAAVGHAVMRTQGGAEADRELFRLVNRGHGAAPDRFFFQITELGSMYAAGAAAGAMVLLGRRRAALRALGAAAVTWGIGQTIKEAVDRPRPYDDDPDGTRRLIAEPRGTSWPSSHPAVLTSFTRVAARELALGAGARVALAALDLSVAASRVYLGVHYPGDVVSGLLLGRAVARLWPGRR
jgi:membrane-associated phospholipid phosphatase